MYGQTLALARVTWKEFFTDIGYFMLPLLMVTSEVLKSLHTLLFWTTSWWNLNKIVWSELQNFEFFTKMFNHFWPSVNTISDIISVRIVWCLIRNLKTTMIFQCSNKYSTPTRVTRSNVGPNMADPISPKENRPLL